MEYFKKKVSIDNEDILLEIWDTAGQERYRSLVNLFYKNAKGAILVFDLCDRSSFLNLEFWLKSIKRNSPDIIIVIIGNKCDQEEGRQVKEEEIKEFCEANGVPYSYTSAKENINIHEAFMDLGRKVKEKMNKTTILENSMHSYSSEFSEVVHKEKGCTICEC